MISVIIPAYNCARDLRVAVASILTQSWSDWECIIVDDGSREPLADSLGVSDPRIVCLRHEKNLGRGAARVTGLGRARGEFVAWQDADDWSYPERLTLQREFLAAHPQVIAVGSGAAVADSGERLMGIRCGRAFEPRLLGELEAPPVLHPTLMLRRQLMAGLPYPSDVRVSEDLVFMRRAFREHPFANLGTPLYCYREEQSQSVAKYWGSTLTRVHTYWQLAPERPARAVLKVAEVTGKALVYTAAAACGARSLLYRRRQRVAEPPEVQRHREAWDAVSHVR